MRLLSLYFLIWILRVTRSSRLVMFVDNHHLQEHSVTVLKDLESVFDTLTPNNRI